MKAILSTQPGPAETLVVGDLPSPEPKPGEVVIRVKAAGVNFFDTLIIQDKYQFKPDRPFAPGGEAAGLVAAVGADVEGLKPGDRVFAAVTWGAMAEEVAAPAAEVFKIPDSLPFDEAAAMMVTYGTAYYSLTTRGDVQPGEKLLIMGAAGGMGVASVEIGKALGAEVYAAAGSQDKVDFALSKGADKGIVYPPTPLDRDQQKAFSAALKDISGGGFDVVQDNVGGDYAEPLIRAMNWNGRFLVIGFPAGIPSIPLNLTLLKSCQIVGVFFGGASKREPGRHRREVAALFDLYERGAIHPHISARYPLDKAADAIKELAERRAKGKIVITIE